MTRILSYVLQDIIFLGDVSMEEFQLNIETDYNYSFDYDPSVEPSVVNEFATAAFRFGHSMIDGILKYVIKQYKLKYITTNLIRNILFELFK